ncbi:MAG: hypothetical protein UY23_C0001G0210 [Candidatus Jorgensenbacteria bacterium GW2011_GWA1_48_11]|uniref:Uncharacterized protein n=1 Tax=Candidatus Jorgensenbacteria bacterium GW2011_GWA1_48_11 TaxID=1618660 RepID=A0A0G1UBW9_9BACT|nr:MAG: hypothetical protein UY23_C0001G0210 [Candidatus Jorgensenbacteria bacterium GW2011_GWA1_48_11]KKW12096.1 MAG: hypothetical protein UY51_C0005G0338 [Candidatus Jorgensenbacteria bacterium GW2011_GWB1_49_9]
MAGQASQLYKKSREYLRELQRAPDRRKKRWLVISSAAAMLLVLGLWMIYLNMTLPTLPKTTDNAPNPAPTSSQNQKESFFQIFGRGLEVTFQNLNDKFRTFGSSIGNYLKEFENKIRESNNFSIQAPTSAFRPNDLEKIPTTTLP